MPISSALGSSALLPAGLGFRNVLINGDFKVWQRGTSGVMATGFGTGYLADRWTSARAGYAAGGTVSRQTASLDGFQYCARVQRDSGNTSTVSSWYFQTLETVTSIPLVNKPVVYSFYIRAGANFSGTVTAQLYSGTATDQGSYPNTGITGSVTVIASALSLTTSWQRVVLYGNVGASATQLFAGFQHVPSGTAGAADYYEVTGVQLEQNYQPTPFEQRPYGVELALCQRYYFKYYGKSGGYGRIPSTGSSYGGAAWQGVVNMPTTMRTTPSSIDYSGIGCTDNVSFDSAAFTGVTLNTANSHSDGLFITTSGGSGITSGAGQILILRGEASAYFGIGAEL